MFATPVNMLGELATRRRLAAWTGCLITALIIGMHFCSQCRTFQEHLEHPQAESPHSLALGQMASLRQDEAGGPAA